MKKYAIHLTEDERREVLHALARLASDAQSNFTVYRQLTSYEKQKKSRALCQLVLPLMERIKDTEPEPEQETPRKCGECAHFKPSEAEIDRKTCAGDCPIYANSDAFKTILANHDRTLPWSPAPGCHGNWKACQNFTPKTPEK